MANTIINDLKAQIKYGNSITKLIIINGVVFFILSCFRILEAFGVFSEFAYAIIDNISFHISFAGIVYKPWTIITYMFTHIELFHIFWNMVTLYWFGQILINYTSEKKIIPLYLMGGIAGALFTTIVFSVIPPFQNYVGSPMIGASAGVTAIIIASAALVPNVRLNLFLIGPVKLIYVALFVVFVDLLNVASQKNVGGSFAHMGGAAMGYFFIVMYKKGIDLSNGINTFFNWIQGVFKRTSTSKLKTVHRRTVSDVDYNASKFENQKQVDAILDKISKSGYDSLSSMEKEILFKASKK